MSAAASRKVRLVNHAHAGRVGRIISTGCKPGKSRHYGVALDHIPGDSRTIHVEASESQIEPFDGEPVATIPIPPKVVGWPET